MTGLGDDHAASMRQAVACTGRLTSADSGAMARGTVVIAGMLLGLAWTVQILVSLYQIWFLKAPEGHPFH